MEASDGIMHLSGEALAGAGVLGARIGRGLLEWACKVMQGRQSGNRGGRRIWRGERVVRVVLEGLAFGTDNVMTFFGFSSGTWKAAFQG